jgi:hypothetical protein
MRGFQPPWPDGGDKGLVRDEGETARQLTLLQSHETFLIQTHAHAVADEESRPRRLNNRLLLVALPQHRHVILVVETAGRWCDVLQVNVSLVTQPVDVRRSRHPRYVRYTSTRLVVPSTDFHHTPGLAFATILLAPLPVTVVKEKSLGIAREGGEKLLTVHERLWR